MPTNSFSNLPRFAVLIVTYNSAAYIERCLDSLKTTLFLEFPNSEICVIDNASSDETVNLIHASFSFAKVLRNSKNRGFSAAINQGLSATSAPFVFWLNPDAELVTGSFSSLLNFFDNHPEAGIAGLKILNPDGSRQFSCRSFPSFSTAFFNRYSILTRLFPKNRGSRQYLNADLKDDHTVQVDWVSGAALIHRRQPAPELSALDESYFMYCEDVDFCKRASQTGVQTYYYPHIVVRHEIGGSSRAVPLQMIRERHRSMWIYYKKHFPRTPIKDAAAAAGIALRCTLLSIFSGLKRQIPNAKD